MSTESRKDASPESSAGEEETAPPAAEEAAAAEEEVPAEAEPDYKDLYVRLQADFQNFRKRLHRERTDAEVRTARGILAEILPVADDLERALETGEENGQALIEGLRLTLRRMKEALERVGIEPVPGEGAPFDPNVHEAVSMAEGGSAPPNSVMEVLESGYTFRGKVLRPAKVIVSRPPAAGD